LPAFGRLRGAGEPGDERGGRLLLDRDRGRRGADAQGRARSDGGLPEGALALLHRQRTAVPAVSDPLFEVRGLTKKFRGLTAVSDVTFRVAPREILGLIGPNGAGKTTIISL